MILPRAVVDYSRPVVWVSGRPVDRYVTAVFTRVNLAYFPHTQLYVVLLKFSCKMSDFYTLNSYTFSRLLDGNTGRMCVTIGEHASHVCIIGFGFV